MGKESYLTFYKSLFSPQRLPWVIIAFGTFVRLVQYLYNRSLWNDEAALALNIVNRSYAELLQPLNYDQAAPIGFLYVEKFIAQVLGNSEYSLRLFPFLSAIVSLFIFYQLAKQCLQPLAATIALALFASLHIIVYYATEVKQYSSDVAIAILLCLLLVNLNRTNLNLKRIVSYAFLGATTIWFSHPVIFVLTGIGIAHILITLINQQVTQTLKLILVFLFWAISFIISYFVSLQALTNQATLINSWESRGTFPTSFLDFSWLLRTFWEFFHKPLGFPDVFLGIAIFAFFVGFYTLIKTKQKTLMLLLLPIVVTLSVAYLKLYPFDGRLVLFLTPFFILIISEGIARIKQKTRSTKLAVVGTLILTLLLVPPIGTSIYLVIQPYEKQEIRPVIAYIKEHQQLQDTIYVYQRAEFQFKYYAPKFGYQVNDYIMGIDDLDKQDGQGISDLEWQRYIQDLNQLKNYSRVWIVFSHVRSWAQESERITSYLNSFGKQIDAFQEKGSFAYLYTFTKS